jgi:Peptidase_C39 like family
VFDETGLSSDDPLGASLEPDEGALGSSHDGLGVVGGDEAQFWQAQEVDGLCGPTSVAMVVSELSGLPVDKDAVTQTAAEAGLLSAEPGGGFGMTAGQVEQLLELHGVPAEIETGDLGRLESHLAAGHGVILGVDASEAAGYEDAVAQADHVLVVTGIDYARDVAVVNDPGRPDGAGLEIPLTALADAWADSGNQMIVTEAAPAQTDDADATSEDGGVSAWVVVPVALGAAGALLAAVRAARRAHERERGLESMHLDEEPFRTPHFSRRSAQPPPPELTFGEGEMD